MTLKVPFEQFCVPGKFVDLQTIGSGHINDTWLARFQNEGAVENVVIQRINRNVFKDPVAVMENMARVSKHLWQKLEHEPDRERKVLRIVPARDGSQYFEDDSGNFWRACPFIDGASTYDRVEKPEQAFQAALAYGRFQKLLLDLEGPPLHETIPQFHSGTKRYSDFLKTLKADTHNRAVDASDSIDFVNESSGDFSHLEKLIDKQILPVRTTHNDTKLNNVLLDDANGEGLCVIDLDTVMPGLSLYDFGDLVRSGATTGHEDEQNLDLVRFNFKTFEALLRGYLSGTSGFLIPAERENLYFSGILMTLIIGVRFLTDHLQGDQYFKISRPGHNLDRARAHFALVNSMRERRDEMSRLVEKVCNEMD